MEKIAIQKFFIRKLRDFSPPKWGASHTEERNLFKGLPKHLIGRKETKDALDELYKIGFISRYKKTYEVHVSLNIEKKKEIEDKEQKIIGWWHSHGRFDAYHSETDSKNQMVLLNQISTSNYIIR